MTIHVDEHLQHQKLKKRLQQGSAAPPPHPAHPTPALVEKRATAIPLFPPLEASTRETSEAPTAPLTPLVNSRGSGVDGGRGHGSGDIMGSDNGMGFGSEVGDGVSQESDKPRRPKPLSAKRLLKNVNKRRSSLSHSRSGSFLAGGILDGRVSKTNLYSLSSDVSAPPRLSPTNAGAASGADDELSEDGYASSGGEMVMGAFEGLKWGEMVQFKMPAEGEVRANPTCRNTSTK